VPLNPHRTPIFWFLGHPLRGPKNPSNWTSPLRWFWE
jgi:hypothetical protein